MPRSSLSPSSSSPPCRPCDLLAPNLRYPGRPDYILLDSCGHTDWVADNVTTAETFTEATKTIKVTFVIADPPSLSSFCVRCPDLGDNPFAIEPKIVWSLEDLALIRVDLALIRVDLATSGSPEYFIYRGGRLVCGPSLDLLPGVGSYFARERLDPYVVGVVPDGDGKDFVLAAYSFKLVFRKPRQYKLHVFRSKRQSWTEELLAPDFPSWLNSDQEVVTPCKVITLRDGVLGYVDLWRGILLCNVLNDPVTVCYVPLPKLLPNNREHYGELLGRPIRDVTCTDGLIIRCVEMEDLYSLSSSIPDASNMDVLFDYEAVNPNEEAEEYDFVGWRLITWFRKISWDYWHKGSMVHVDELGTVSLPQLEDDGSTAGKLPLKDLKTSCPILCGDDVVCLMSKLGQKAWVVTVDMLKKAVGEPMPCDAKRSLPFNSTYIPCVLNKYLKIESDGVQVGMHDARSRGGFTPQLPKKYSMHYRNISLGSKPKKRCR